MGNDDKLPSLEELGDKITKARGSNPNAEDGNQGGGRALSSGAELIAGVAVGGFIGYHLDQWMETRPLWTILMIFLGAAGGVMNIYRAGMKDSEPDH